MLTRVMYTGCQSAAGSVGHFHWTFPVGHIPTRTFSPPGQFSSPPRAFLPRLWIWKLALTHTPNPNRSTAINFVHVNGRSLYTVDLIVGWWWVVERENVLQHVQKRRNCPRGGNVRGICPGTCPDPFAGYMMCWSRVLGLWSFQLCTFSVCSTSSVQCSHKIVPLC